MPSDDSLIGAALDAMQEPAEAFHSALAQAVEELRTFIARHQAADGDPSALAASELGAFSEGRVDATRFAALAAQPETVELGDLHHVERAHEALSVAEKKGTDLLRTRVPGGGDLREVVARALGETGRVFGEIHRITPVLDGSGVAPGETSLKDGYPFALWTRAERAAAPPLFVELDGGDLNVGGLSEFLDGSQKIVLVVRGPAPPAALARLLSPGVFVMQTADPVALARAAAVHGPAIIALGTEGMVAFTHDPRAGSCYAERITVEEIPDVTSLPTSGFRLREDVEHLRELAASQALTVASPEAPSRVAAVDQADADPVDRLAGWLLQQAGFVDGNAQN